MYSKAFDRKARGNSNGQSTAYQAQSERYGLIILGNSGVGKSFIANLYLQNEVFEHKCKPSAVTKITEYEELYMDGKTYVIFNIPGLVEAKQEQIDVNKQEIDKAFRICPNSIVIYVFGAQQGRIRNEDVVAFNALHAAYPFNPKSLVIVVNGIPPERDEDYEDETTLLLRSILEMEDACETICFLDQIDKRKPKELERLTNILLNVISNSFPEIHQKQQPIRMDVDQIEDLTSEINRIQLEFEKQRREMLEKLNREKRQREAEWRTERQQRKQQLQEQREKSDSIRRQLKSHEKRNAELEKELRRQNRDQQPSEERRRRNSSAERVPSFDLNPTSLVKTLTNVLTLNPLIPTTPRTSGGIENIGKIFGWMK